MKFGYIFSNPSKFFPSPKVKSSNGRQYDKGQGGLMAMLRVVATLIRLYKKIRTFRTNNNNVILLFNNDFEFLEVDGFLF